MKILRASAYGGPNIIAAKPVVHLSVAIEGNRFRPEGPEGAAARAALLRLLPELTLPTRAGAAEGGFAALGLAEVIGEIAVALLRRLEMAGGPVGVRQDGDTGPCHIFFAYEDPEVGVLAGKTAVALVAALLPGGQRPATTQTRGLGAEAILARFLRQAQSMALDQTARALIAEAARRDIPWFILDRPRRIVQLGQGRHLRRIRETVTGGTGAIGTWLQHDKATTARIFAEMHLPVPRQGLAANPDAAAHIAARIGFPVVVKPSDTGKGKGISLGVADAAAVRVAFAVAARYSRRVLVESFVPGDDHRILVVEGRVVAAAKRIPAAVTGDGRQSVAELVAEANRDPRRGVGFSRLMNRIDLDAQADSVLRRQGHDRASIPAAGEVVFLRQTANISTGGTAIDVTEVIHPENRAMLERAARISGLDIVGIDFITPDIARSYRDVGGAICEINSSPGLRPHQVAAQVPGAPPRDVVGPIVDHLFPGGGNGRIPVAAITGTNGKTTTSRMLAHILDHAGPDIGVGVVGLVTTSGVTIDGRLVAKGDFAGGTGARILLRDPAIDAAVLETARGGIIKSGLAFDWCDVGAVLNVGDDHLGLHGVESVEDMARVKGRVAEAARSLAVLNADDPLCAGMAALKPPGQVCLFTLGALDETLRAHVDRGGPAICLETRDDGETICLHRPEGGQALVAVAALPATLDGTARHNVQNAMAAAGLAIGLGLQPARIAEALRGFRGDHADNPGRLNFFEGYPFKVVHDSAHNPDGIKVVCEVLRRIPVAGRRICVLSGVGFRHGDHIGEVADIIAGQFDFFICSRREKVLRITEVSRDFPLEEVPGRIAAALIERGVDPSKVVAIDLDTEAVDRGLAMAREGDLLALLTGMVEWTWDRMLVFGGGARS
jgi:cyanophycin synthetase